MGIAILVENQLKFENPGGGFGQICSIPEPKRPLKNMLFGFQNSKLLNFHFLTRTGLTYHKKLW